MLVFLLLSYSITARQKDDKKTTPGILIAAKSGTSFMVTELHRDFSGTVNEFNNLPGPFAGIEISRFVTHSVEAGAGISYAFLKGRAAVPGFSAAGYQHYLEESPDGPVQYNNRIYGPLLFARFHFGRRLHMPRSLNLFLKAGAGVIFYESELFYSDRQHGEIIFGKRRGQFANSSVTNLSGLVGGGLNYNLPGQVSINLAANMNMVGYDFLDVVHNFNPEGSRREVVGLFTDLTAGITIRLNKKQSTGPSGSCRFCINRHLPFSPD